MPCCSPPSTTTRLLATSLARVKGKVHTIEELPKLTEKTLGKREKRDGEEEEGMWNN
jgi:hypothetical protein